MNNTVQLSKSKLMSARQCAKRLHLEVHRPQLAKGSPSSALALRNGNAVGNAAKLIYGGEHGMHIPRETGLKFALEETARLLHEPANVPILEATFLYGGVLVRIDALLPAGNAWRIVEVKASTSIKDEHVVDCAIQRWVFEGAGHKLESIALAHVDSSYVYDGRGSYEGMLTEVDLTAETQSMLPLVPDWVMSATEAAGSPLPEVVVGAQCSRPYDCPFMAHCWSSNAEYPVKGLGGSRAKLGALIAAGYEDLREVPESELDSQQVRIQRVAATGKPELLEAARRFVANLDYPRYYLDFETIMPAVPLWPETRPYEILPFQWSCHFERRAGEIEHAEFIDLSGEPPMRRLAQSLVRVLGNDGPVLTYTTYEKRVIAGLAKRFPGLAASLLAISSRLVDLKPVTKANYYHPEMTGSWSLKTVIPTVTSSVQYEKLVEIQEGNAASEGYLEIISGTASGQRVSELKEQLLRYCELDTRALVELAGFLGSAEVVDGQGGP